MKRTLKCAVIGALVGVTALGAIAPAWSAPVMSSTTALKSATPSDVSDVRYRGGRRYYRNDGAAIALGVLGVVGAVAATQAYRRQNRGYGYGGYGNPGYYQQGYAYGPRYGYGPSYYGRSW